MLLQHLLITLGDNLIRYADHIPLLMSYLCFTKIKALNLQEFITVTLQWKE